VKDKPSRWINPFLWPALEILLRRLQMKSDSMTAGLHFAVVSNDPHSFVVEPGFGRPIVRDIVQIPEQKSFHIWIAKMSAHRLLEDRQIVFMHDLVGLKVDRPIAGTV
jgi:hypothetical protein